MSFKIETVPPRFTKTSKNTALATRANVIHHINNERKPERFLFFQGYNIIETVQAINFGFLSSSKQHFEAKFYTKSGNNESNRCKCHATRRIILNKNAVNYTASWNLGHKPPKRRHTIMQ